ncbi:DUF6318 family protein [Georgenia faecalis]|uniref:DUF6318 family protein n=1 Tax=Georgenia faecalis TaxID=2483799 RepID=A0ABV9DAW5_9MICO
MPERPDSMDRDDVVGAKAAAQYFIEMYPYVYATGDLEEWREMSHEECEFCFTVIDNVEQMHRDGEYGLGGGITVDEVMVMDPEGGVEGVAVALRVTEAPSAVYSEAGTVQSSTMGGDAYYVPTLVREADQWLVTTLAIDTDIE